MKTLDEMSFDELKEKLLYIESQMRAGGMRSFHISFDEDAHKASKEDIMKETIQLFQAMLDGKGTLLSFNDSKRLLDLD